VHENLRLEAIRALAAFSLDAHEPSGCENSKMTCGCRPAMRKPLGDFAGCHPALVPTQSEKDLPSRTMRERGEDRVHRSRIFGRPWIVGRHPGPKILAIALIKDNFYFS
jgi:hypothetical protein